MSSTQPSQEKLSPMISEVLDEVGVNDRMIEKRRSYALFGESVYTFGNEMEDRKMTTYMFGSQSEGTTTTDIDSDVDGLSCKTDYHVINDISHWRHGVKTLLMLQDETTAPGYCLLQLLKDDVPEAAESVPDHKNFCIDGKDRVLLRNTVFIRPLIHYGMKQHGPAIMPPTGQGGREMDAVFCYHCSQWPLEARRWLTRRSVNGWPSDALKRKCETTGCFLVPFDSKISKRFGVEWRMSTTLAERHLMFSLNSVHRKCYVLMKLLLKSDDVFKDISSYMCKTALLHCVEKTTPKVWDETHLIKCLNRVLRMLYDYIKDINCPHFIIPENNLMAGKISETQQKELLDVIDKIIKSKGKMLFSIELDNIGDRLKYKLGMKPSSGFISSLDVQAYISGELTYHSAQAVAAVFLSYLDENKNNRLEDILNTFVGIYITFRTCNPQFNDYQKKASSYLSSLIGTAIGSLTASYYIEINQQIPDLAITWIKRGINSDVSSSMLKLATVYYRAGDMNTTADILTSIDKKYDREVVYPVCGCIKDRNWFHKIGFDNTADCRSATEFENIVSYCVIFMRSEINIVPEELRQEFERSREEDTRTRSHLDNIWMDFSVIDSLPYLYFLQYKTFGSLQKKENQRIALEKLKNVAQEEYRLWHKETIFNLLGQCMEQENLPNEALGYYQRSLEVRPENNAAKFYRSRLPTPE